MLQPLGIDLGLVVANARKNSLSKAVDELVIHFSFNGEATIVGVGVDFCFIQLVFNNIWPRNDNDLNGDTGSVALAVGDGGSEKLVVISRSGIGNLSIGLFDHFYGFPAV